MAQTKMIPNTIKIPCLEDTTLCKSAMGGGLELAAATMACAVGCWVGVLVGNLVGALLGCRVGCFDGDLDGVWDGGRDGEVEDALDGVRDGRLLDIDVVIMGAVPTMACALG